LEEECIQDYFIIISWLIELIINMTKNPKIDPVTPLAVLVHERVHVV